MTSSTTGHSNTEATTTTDAGEIPKEEKNPHREALTAFVTSLSESEETIRDAVQD
jgi:hypothetical protein